MGLLDAYQDSTDRALTVMAARPIDPEPPKPKHSGWSTIPRAVAGAFVETAGNIMDVASAYGQVQAATGANANPLIPDTPEDRKQRLEAYDKLKTEGIDWQPEESRPHYQMAQDLRPDPITAGTAENIVFSVTKGLTKAIGAGMITGPVAGATAFGVSEGMTTAEDLAAQGVDVATRTKVGAVTGALNAAGMALPVAGTTLLKTAGLVAAGGPASFMAQQLATRKILESADYGKLAQQYDPLDPVGLAVATLLPAGFATWAMRGAFKGKPVATPDQVDAAMVHNLTIARDAHEVGPLDISSLPKAKRAPDLSAEHRNIETTAYQQVLKDPAGMVDSYFERFGNTIDPDNVKKLFPAFAADQSLAAAVHEPSSALAKMIFTEGLKRNDGKPVIFTAGGSGSGKTEARPIALLASGKDGSGLIYDSTLSSFKSATEKIQEALDSGAPVDIVYTNRHVDSAFNFAMTRDRVVPVKTIAQAHVGASDTIRAVAEHYKDNPNVSIFVVNNHGSRHDMHLGSIDQVFKYEHNQIERRLYDLAYQARDAGAITADRYAALTAKNHAGELAGGDQAIQPGQQGQDLRGSGQGDGRQGQGGLSGNAQEIARLDSVFPVQGRSSVSVTERGTTIETRFVVVESKSLVTSHDNALNPNPKFPQELQPRDRTRSASEAQIAKIENGINPELLADSPKASDGAPIIGADKVVESGNARTIALRRAYAGKKADAYRTWLIDNAERFGLDPAAIKAMKQPILARVRETSVNRAEFARQANESPIAQMSVTELAKSDAARMPDLVGLVANDDGSINTLQSAPFIRSFLSSAVSPSEHGSMMSADGTLSQQGLQRIRNAVFAKAYGDPEVVAMMAESTDANVKNILGGMLRAAPAVARLKDMIESGARYPRDITTDLVQAVRQFSQLRRDGKKVEQMLAQHGLFEGGPSTEVKNLLIGLEENAKAPKRIGEMIGRYVDAVDSLGDPRQAGIFGDAAPPSSPDLVAKAIEDVRSEYDVKPTADLFQPGDIKDPYVSSVMSRIEELKAQRPDMPVALREDGTPVTLAEELDAIRRQAREGTADTFGANDAPLIQVAVECLLSMGAA